MFLLWRAARPLPTAAAQGLWAGIRTRASHVIPEHPNLCEALQPYFSHPIDVLQRPSVIDVGSEGRHEASHLQIQYRALQIARQLTSEATSVQNSSVGFLLAPNSNWLATLIGIWLAGKVAVPMCSKHSANELAYVLEDAHVDTVIHDATSQEHLQAALQSHPVEHVLDAQHLMSFIQNEPQSDALHAAVQRELDSVPEVSQGDGALVIYTSGTTSLPKGVLHTHFSLANLVGNLVSAWEWTSHDRIMNFLPLHHVHGIINVVACAALSGATLEMYPGFSAPNVFDRLRTNVSKTPDRTTDMTLLMAVPTIYSKLLQEYERRPESEQAEFRAGCRDLRLTVSGSAALPTPVLERFRKVSGHTLLERYGMTEIGMALGNPLHGERIPGAVGQPFQNVVVKVRLPHTHERSLALFSKASVPPTQHPHSLSRPLNLLLNAAGPLAGDSGDAFYDRSACEEEPEPAPSIAAEGEICIKSHTMFKEYLNKPDATDESFDTEGFFRTGDIGRYDPQKQTYSILGRASQDIIKTGGFKLSALEIERILLAHQAISDGAIVGVDDETWGQRVVAVVVFKEGADPLTLEALRDFMGTELASYKLPTALEVLPELPRNAMGKVNKKQLAQTLQQGATAA
ncbi:uncharacterized protein MONBRDRAFT_26383 [Monosiga brevicollis MX1]|uniref:Uncharacterized protein n=1 Tax=Monosiga brevicollis TaxID=81824 RepID=A9V276_MONBE|nr:uncharacterized protein MONBRDRAFT_26383 [Monosiga brevicollis MX1]EDQ88206.1 predicted protein [Monosiga brevicollis MX1]|eukprot:XP_001746799.1 hypothetical protein [Monosiga brevicollis MX1]